jgi:hypothetical protein
MSPLCHYSFLPNPVQFIQCCIILIPKGVKPSRIRKMSRSRHTGGPTCLINLVSSNKRHNWPKAVHFIGTVNHIQTSPGALICLHVNSADKHLTPLGWRITEAMHQIWRWKRNFKIFWARCGSEVFGKGCGNRVICTTDCNTKHHNILLTECVCAFQTILTVNSNYFPK